MVPDCKDVDDDIDEQEDEQHDQEYREDSHADQVDQTSPLSYNLRVDINEQMFRLLYPINEAGEDAIDVECYVSAFITSRFAVHKNP